VAHSSKAMAETRALEMAPEGRPPMSAARTGRRRAQVITPWSRKAITCTIYTRSPYHNWRVVARAARAPRRADA
jgi:hypothetical protein